MDSAEHNTIKYSISYQDTQMDFRNIKRLQKIIRLIDPCDDFLDIGCWDGYLMKQFVKSGKVKKAVGVDNSKSAIEMAKKDGLEVVLVESVDKKIPFGDESFDCVFAGEIIEHIYDVNNFTLEIERVLKKNGQLIITTPNLASFGSRMRLLFGKTPWMIENILEKDSAGHIRYFTFDSLEKVLEDRGFTVEQCATNVIQLNKYNLTGSLADLFYKLGSNIIIKCRKN
ncbi:MAG: methyltransferase domain-containing protein [Patescibacteria group bacterium]|jgi:SAM-dependent methyltransferase